MTTRADLIETAVRACLIGTDEEESLAETLGFDENYARAVVVPTVLDAVLPQITTAEQLEALPARALVYSQNRHHAVAVKDDTWTYWRRLGGDVYTADDLIANYGPLVILWQPQPEQETRADA